MRIGECIVAHDVDEGGILFFVDEVVVSCGFLEGIVALVCGGGSSNGEAGVGGWQEGEHGG